MADKLAQEQMNMLPSARVRWRIPFAGFLLALMGGFAYAWGVFVTPMVDRFGWSTAETTLPLTIYLMFYALSMAPAGRLQDRFGPRIVSLVGAALFFVAYSLAALVGYFPFAWWLVVTYGVIGGTACGITYSCIIPPARKWFPDKPGFAVASALMGFGLAAMAVAPIKSEFLLPVFGIEGTLLFFGGVTSIVSFCASRMLKNPPEGWMLQNREQNSSGNTIFLARQEYTPRQVIRTSLFWMIWFTLGLVISGGLMSIGLIPSYGRFIGLASTEAALAVSIFSIFNGFGRPVAGFLADRFGIIRVMMVTYIIQTVILLTFPVFAVSLPSLFLASALLGWAFAVTLGLFPVLTATFFGVKNLGINYGLVFTAYAVGALTPALGSWIFDTTGSYTPAFVAAGVLAGVGLVFCSLMRAQQTGQNGQAEQWINLLARRRKYL